MPSTISPKEFAHAVAMTKKAEVKGYATLPALKKMLGCRPLDIMDFIEEHPDLVHTEPRCETKIVKVRMPLPGTGRSYWSTEARDGKSLGLCIIDAYECAEDNPWTEAGLQKLITTHTKTVWASKVDNYGEILGEVLREDTIPKDSYGRLEYPDGKRPADARKAEWLWRNTHEKLETLKSLGAVKNHKYWMGGVGDAYSRDEPFSLSAEGIKILEANGWTLIR